MLNNKLAELEEALGYIFKNKQHIKTALTLAKYANEKGIKSNERLEFLGDSTLRYTVSQYLYEQFPLADEGELSIMRDKLVKADTLNGLAFRLGVMNFTLGWDRSAKAMGSTIEAIIGAIFIDGGHKSAAKFVVDNICSEKVNAEQDAKTQLQVKCQPIIIKYITEREVNTPDHKPLFNSSVYIGMEKCGHGIGSSKAAAEQNAAQQALRHLSKTNLPYFNANSEE